MSGYLLILAIILLGGAIATIGDRLGTRVGKARLSLFKMRPKQTAIIVTILTGSVISTATIGILLGTSSTLRDGLIRIDEIRAKSKLAEEELQTALAQKKAAQTDLDQAEANLQKVVGRLRTVNRSLKQAQVKQKRSELQLKQLQSKFNQAQASLKKTQGQTQTLRKQISQLFRTSKELKNEQARLIQQRNAAQSNLAKATQQRRQLEGNVQQAQAQLKNVGVQKRALEAAIAKAQTDLEQAQKQELASKQALERVESELSLANLQRKDLQQDIVSLAENRKRLEQNVRLLTIGLRQGNVTIRSGQVLASAVISNQKTPEDALKAFNQLRQKARIAAIIRTNPPNATPDQRIIQFFQQDQDVVIRTLSDGGSYFVRILSALNYLEGEQTILAIPQVAPNRLVYKSGVVLSSTKFVPSSLPQPEAQILAKINTLFAAAKQKAIQDGVLRDPLTGNVGEGNAFTLLKFALAIQEANYAEEIQVITVTREPTFTSGPLRLELVALKNNQVILRSD